MMMMVMMMIPSPRQPRFYLDGATSQGSYLQLSLRRESDRLGAALKE